MRVINNQALLKSGWSNGGKKKDIQFETSLRNSRKIIKANLDFS